MQNAEMALRGKPVGEGFDLESQPSFHLPLARTPVSPDGTSALGRESRDGPGPGLLLVSPWCAKYSVRFKNGAFSFVAFRTDSAVSFQMANLDGVT